MKFRIIILTIFFVAGLLRSQSTCPTPLAHTYSIVAYDSATGQVGAAVQSHWFSVGSNVIWAEAGVGAVATQSFVNVSFGPRGLQLLKSGMSPQQALDSLLASDQGREFRQVALIDAKGHAAAFTGDKCIEAAGDAQGENFSVQANLMLNDNVWPAMEVAFKNARGPLAERLIAALEAAQAEGGDIRGKQSAAILVVSGNPTGKVWKDRLIDLRVEDSENPVKELKRLLKVHRAYQHMNAGDAAVEKNDQELALKEYATAETMMPDNIEMKYWHAVALVNMDRLEEALPILKAIFEKDRNWEILTPRLVPNGLLNVSEKELQRILNVGKAKPEPAKQD